MGLFAQPFEQHDPGAFSRSGMTGWDGDAPRDPSPGPEVAGCSGRLGGWRILIVEDEALLAMDMQFTFEDEGAEVVGPALSLDQAIALIMRAEPSGAPIHGAILDVDVAGRDVYPVAATLRERGVPIVFHTGHGSRIRLAEMFPGSVTCSKPTLPETLVLTLLQLLP